MSRHRLLSRSSSARVEQSALSVNTSSPNGVPMVYQHITPQQSCRATNYSAYHSRLSHLAHSMIALKFTNCQTSISYGNVTIMLK